ncbi:MAG: hypothetical protein GQ546_07840 [Gammaproteobacteria bacterium]|nr:hypothetical protein [Gammaproteobacteria bacterium]
MNVQGIKTKYGTLRGRDAIYLNSVMYKNAELIIKGEVNSELLSNYEGEHDFIPYELKFGNVIANYQIELDYYNHSYLEYSFQEITGSDWIKKLKEIDCSNKINEKHKHFVLATYDDIFEIIAGEYTFNFLK